MIRVCREGASRDSLRLRGIVEKPERDSTPARSAKSLNILRFLTVKHRSSIKRVILKLPERERRRPILTNEQRVSLEDSVSECVSEQRRGLRKS